MTSIQVAIKVRPLIQRENDENKQSLWTVVDEKTIRTHNKEHVLTFDKIFDETRTTQELFDSVAKPIISSAIEGINGTIFAYGQTSSGKTYCMMGTEEHPGIVPLTAAEIFKQIEQIQGHEFLIRIGYIEIYNEKVYDLLDPNKCEIVKCRENLQNEVIVDQTEIVVMRPGDILEKFDQGNKNRRVEETNMNDQSSRSHALFRIVIESKKEGSNGVVKVSKIFLVDLAGSERASQTKASGDRLREGGCINKSLLFLSKIIRELGNNQAGDKKHINYRDSKLTRILSTSLGGNAQTAIICAITPANIDETLSTFTFASNAKKVKTLPKVNEILSDEVLMQRMQKEIAGLRVKLHKAEAKNEEEIQARIREQIFEREVAFIHSGLPIVEKENRRRTWVCPGALVNEAIASKSSNSYRPAMNQFLAPPPPFVLPRIAIDNNDENVRFFDENAHDYADEIFMPSNDVNLDRTLSPSGGRTTDDLMNLIRTPRSLLPNTFFPANSPNIGSFQDPYERIARLEMELQEVLDYKLLEMNIQITDEDVKKMQSKIDNANEELSKCENTIDDLRADMKAKDEVVSEYKTKLQLAQNESKKAFNEKKETESLLAGIQFELELVKSKAKTRESELLTFVDDAREESKCIELYEQIKALEEELALHQSNNGQNMRIKELEDELQLFREDRQAMKQTISEQKAEMEKLQKIELELSDQIIEAVQDSDKLQLEIDQLNAKYAQVADNAEKASRFEKIQELLACDNENLAEDDDDDTGKLIIKLRQDSAKVDTLEVEKLQLIKDLDEIRHSVVVLSEKLVASQAVVDMEPQMRHQIEMLSVELIATKKLLNEHGTQHDALVDDLRQQLEKVNRENLHMTATLKECESLEADVDLLNRQKQQRDDKIDELLAKIEQLKVKASCEDKETSMSDLETSNDEKLALESEIQKLNLINRQIEADLGASNITISGLLDKLSLNQSVIDDMSEKLAEKDQQISLSAESTEIKSKVDDEAMTKLKDAEIQTLQQEIVELQQDYDKLKEDINQCEAQITEKDEKIAQLEVEIFAVRESQSNEQVDAKKLQSALDDKKKLEMLNEELQKLIKDTKDTEESLKLQLDEVEQQKAEIISKNSMLSQQVHTLTHSNASFSSIVKEFEEREMNFDIFKAQKDAKITELTNKLLEIEQKHNQSLTDEEKAKFEFEKQKLKEENAKVEEQKQQLENRVQQLEDQFIKSKTVCDELQSQLNVNKASIEELSGNLKKSVEGEEKLNNINADYKMKVAQYEQKIANCDQKMAEYEHKIDDYQKKVAYCEQIIAGCDQKMVEYQKNIACCDQKIAEYQKNISGCDQKIADYEHKVANCENLIADYQTKVANYEQKFNDFEKKNAINEAKLIDYALMIEETKFNFTGDMKKFRKCEKSCEVKDEELEKLKAEILSLKTALEQKASDSQELKTKLTKLVAKVQEVETERNTKHNSLSEVKQKFAQLQAQHANCKSYSNAAHEKQLSEMKAALDLKATECADARLRLRRRSQDNMHKQQELESKNHALIQQLGEIEALKLNADVEIKRMKEEHKKASDENDLKFSVLDEKYAQLCEMNQKLEAQLKAPKENKFKVEIDRLNAELTTQMSLNFINAKTVGELRQKCEDLTQQLHPGTVVVKKISSSPNNPTQRRSSEHEDETFALQHKKLFTETNSGTPVRAQRSNNERKTRRQSVVDDRRRISVWEAQLCAETQTDIFNDECACCELRMQVKELKTQIRVNECKISNYERLSKVAKADVKQAQMEMERGTREQAKVKENYELEIANLQKKVKTMKSEMEKVKNERPHRITRASQTSPHVNNDKLIIEEVQREKLALERKVSELEKQLQRFEEEKNVAEKENINQNGKMLAPVSSGQNAQGGTRSQLDETLRKYDMAKRLCTMRNETIEKLNKENHDLHKYNEQMRASYQTEMRKAFQENVDLKAINESVKYKYEHAKEVCDKRFEKLQAIRQKYGEVEPSTDESQLSPRSSSSK